MCSRLDTPKSLLTPRDRSKSRHNDPTVIKHCQNVRLTSAKLPVKFQLDCWKIKTNFPWACIHGFGSTWLAVFRDGQKTPSTYGSSFPPNDPTVIKHCQIVRLTSAKLPVKFQLDCWKIKTNFPWACIHGFGSTWLLVFLDGQKTPSTYGSSFPPNDQTVIKLRQNLRLASTKRYVKFKLDSDKITENFTIACVHVSTPQSPYLLPGTVLNPDIMIRQSSNIVRMCASPARNCL